MNEKVQNLNARTIEPWPPGWPLPLSAVAPALRWEDAVEVYLAYCESFGVPADQPATDGQRNRPPVQQAA